MIICYCVRRHNKRANVSVQSGVLPHSNYYTTTTHIQQAPPVQTFQLPTRSEPLNQSSNSDYNNSDGPPAYSDDNQNSQKLPSL